MSEWCKINLLAIQAAWNAMNRIPSGYLPFAWFGPAPAALKDAEFSVCRCACWVRCICMLTLNIRRETVALFDSVAVLGDDKVVCGVQFASCFLGTYIIFGRCRITESSAALVVQKYAIFQIILFFLFL